MVARRRAQCALANHGAKIGYLYVGAVSGMGRLIRILRPEMQRW